MLIYIAIVALLIIIAALCNGRKIYCATNNVNYRIPKEKSSKKIPKIIHQIWIGPREVPYQWINTVKHFALTYGYVYHLWRDEDIRDLPMINKDVYELQTTWAGKADIARYEILRLYGGIYIDADSVIVNLENGKLDKLFTSVNTDFFAAVERDCLIANGVIGSVPNGKFINKVIKYIQENMLKMKIFKGFPFFAIGPYCITSMYYAENNQKLATIFPSKYFYPVFWGSVNLSKKTKQELEQMYPDAMMVQIGFTTNKL